ncbi:MAG: pyridoxal-phosphate dependent enzyme [Bacteroidales bacterium]|jgi:threonine synthase|nr:pyridoxal-phosphate dependent enzyme [Bacteroidales bacterium]
MSKAKFHFRCVACGRRTPDFPTWFSQNQQCPECKSKHAEIEYNVDYTAFPLLLKENDPKSFWHYFDYLPLHDRKNIVSCQEGAIPLERWSFFEQYAAEQHKIDCKIYVYRNDLNGGTNTFKDIAASMAASVLKEHNINQYCIASTGNTATAYGKYLAIAGINAAIFMPKNSVEASQAEIASYGQQVYSIDGDYTYTKQVAADYARKFSVLISSGNIDPIRIESKRTMVFEWLRLLGRMPDVYIQAISGGTGPLALDKAVRELSPCMSDLHLPKLLMVQTDKCDPMVQAWENAKAQNFPQGFEQQYPIIDNPKTAISILATGNPTTYPMLAGLLRKYGGNFLRVKEDKVIDVTRLVAYERKTHIGPASAVCILGLLKAIEQGEIQNNQTVLVNIGEGIKRAPAFLHKLGHHIKNILSVDDCYLPDMNRFRKELWKNALD